MGAFCASVITMQASKALLGVQLMMIISEAHNLITHYSGMRVSAVCPVFHPALHLAYIKRQVYYVPVLEA